MAIDKKNENLLREINDLCARINSLKKEKVLSCSDLFYRFKNERRLTEELFSELRKEKDILQTIIEHTDAEIAYLDKDFNFVKVNSIYVKRSGYKEKELIGKNHFELFPNKENEEIFKHVKITGEPIGFKNKPFDHKPLPKELTHLEWSLTPVKKNRKVIGFVLKENFSNILEKIKFMEFHDVLTGLPNRIYFNQLLNEWIDESKKKQEMIALFFLDLDNFKYIKNTLGHETGYKLIKAASIKLAKVINEANCIGRVGDEFLLCQKNISDIDEINAKVEKILGLFERTWFVDGKDINVLINLGVSIFPQDGASARTLQEKADIAMTSAKNKLGANSFKFYDKSMKTEQEEAFRKLDLQSKITTALEKKEFESFYQPIININTNEFVGIEALVRWKSPRGILQPKDFIPIAEETGQIFKIGDWVLETACNQHNKWLDKGYDSLRLNVNLSARQFQQKDLAKKISIFLEKTEIIPSQLFFEITESSLMINPKLSIKTMNLLKNIGVGLSIDDFGTGYSSLKYLKEFPVDIIKIDMSFINDITSNAKDEAIVDSIITLSHGLGFKVTAEGVEREDQLNKLKELKCDDVQGFLFSRPLPASKFEEKFFKNKKAA